MSKNTESLDLVFTYNEYSSTQTATQGDKNSLEHYKELAAEDINEQNEDTEDWEEIGADDLELEKSDLPEWLQDEDTLNELLENWEDYDLDIYEAANDGGVDLNRVRDSYCGRFDDDEDFAREQAESCGSIDRKAIWPQTCIDWEQAAKELMYDYTESNGHYFSNY